MKTGQKNNLLKKILTDNRLVKNKYAQGLRCTEIKGALF